MEFTLEQKIGFINLLVQRCDRLSKNHGDKDGCNSQCNEIIKAIEKDLKDIDVMRSFDHGRVS
jgi:hypothetical protein